MTEEEEKLRMELKSDEHKRLLMEVRNSEKWKTMSSDAREVYLLL